MYLSHVECVQERQNGAVCKVESYQRVTHGIPIHCHHVLQHHQHWAALRLVGEEVGGGGGGGGGGAGNKEGGIGGEEVGQGIRKGGSGRGGGAGNKEGGIGGEEVGQGIRRK